MTDKSDLTPQTGMRMEDPYAEIRTARADRVRDAAVAVAGAEGLTALSRSRVADAARVSLGTVSNAYGTMQALRDAVMHEAVNRPILSILAQGLAMGDPIARAAPEHVRQAALATLT
jgi:AcrR family transcriptional regulator